MAQTPLQDGNHLYAFRPVSGLRDEISKHEEELPQQMSSTVLMAEIVLRIGRMVISFLLQAFEAVYEAIRFLPCLMVLCFSARSLIGPPEFEVDFTWSPEKIREALKEIEFSKSEASAPVGEIGDKDCTICLSEFVEGESLYMFPECNHVFHKACLSQWLLRNKTTCPICRSSLKFKQQFEEEVPSGIPFQDWYSVGNHVRT